MGPLDIVNHLFNFVAPAAAIALVLVAAAGAWLAQRGGDSAQPLFYLVFVGMVVYGIVTVVGVWRTPLCKTQKG